MGYIENPKMKGSGLLACIPQKGECPNNCEDCFFNSSRSYLQPLEDNLPNIPWDVENIVLDKIMIGINKLNHREVIAGYTRPSTMVGMDLRLGTLMESPLNKHWNMELQLIVKWSVA